MRIDRADTQKIRPRSAQPGSAPAAEGFSQLVEVQQEEAPEGLVPTRPLVAPGMLPHLPPSAELQDREARRHGGAVLRALGGLQLAMLGGDGGEALRILAGLAADPPGAADPGLDQVMRAIAQRAAVELARVEVGA